MAASTLLTGYETIMNHYNSVGADVSTVNFKQLSGQQPISYLARSTNLFNEGLIGYSILAFIGFSAVMFGRELFGLQKTLKELSSLECTCEVSLMEEVKKF